uniref:Uncharacterized protein n=1 Tax=Aegilops tauschii subsp. strangulata TaxID=200361 RepID=A0A453CSC4_AEGTS
MHHLPARFHRAAAEGPATMVVLCLGKTAAGRIRPLLAPPPTLRHRSPARAPPSQLLHVSAGLAEGAACQPRPRGVVPAVLPPLCAWPSPVGAAAHALGMGSATGNKGFRGLPSCRRPPRHRRPVSPPSHDDGSGGGDESTLLVAVMKPSKRVLAGAAPAPMTFDLRPSGVLGCRRPLPGGSGLGDPAVAFLPARLAPQ